MNKINSLNDSQYEAVYARNCSILVSAPAGSGKTKILVNRIMSLLELDYYNVDELLVLTFTKAAALEMKQRLELTLDERLKDDLNESLKLHLLKQKAKLPQSYITHFHGFCSQLLKQYGYLIGINSNFEIISNPILIKHDILDQCIETWLNDDEFVDFIRLNFSDYNFNNFKSILFKLATLSHTTYDFNNYINNIKINIYNPIINHGDINAWKLNDILKTILLTRAIEGKNKVIELKNFCTKHHLTFFYNNPYLDKKQELPTPYDTYLKYFNDLINDLNNCDLETIINKGKPTLSKTYSASFDEETRIYQKEYNALKGTIIKHYASKFDDFIYQDINEFKEILNISYQTIDYLLKLLNRFEQQYIYYKQANNILDFNDLEGYTLKLLEPKYGISSDLYHQLKEIMIDEYQDTNLIQETLINKISKFKQPNINSFMVGDMKQSIYRFREADPEIFNQKYSTYSLTNEDTEITKTKRIDLKYNYRSNKIVLDSVNYIFNQIMDKDIGGLDYYLDDSAKLNYDYLRKEGALTLDQESSVKQAAINRLNQEERFTSEILVTTKDSVPSGEAEAMMVAKRISELVNQLELDDYKVGKRICEYKDIVVLMRSTKEFITFKKVFDRYHIPNQIVLSQGFLEAQEIINSIYVLKALNNHLDDIALTSLLKGNYLVSHFDEDFLVRIRQDKSKSIYDNLISYVENKLSDYQKVNDFLDYYHELIDFSKNNYVYDTLLKFYQDSNYRLFVASLINGEQRVANLDLLVEMFKDDKDLDLNTIVNNYTAMLENKINLSPAMLVSTNNNQVSFMTIHKSKGLEFPVVFVSQLHSQFNKQDSKERIISDKNLGIAIKPRTRKNLGDYQDVIIEYDNKYRKIIANYQLQETVNEEMRIFYVALTRASQKLILTGVIDSPNVIVKWQNSIINNEDDDILNERCNDKVLLYRNIRNTSSYLQWLGLSIIRHPSFINQCKNKDLGDYIDEEIINQIKLNADTINIYQNINNNFDNTMHAKFHFKYISPTSLKQMIIPINHKENKIDYNKIKLFNNYSYPNSSNIEKTIAVTKKINDGDRIFIDAKYEKDEYSNIKANTRGTLIHSVMEHMPIINNLNLDEYINQLVNSNNYSKDEIDLIYQYKEHINQFIKSNVYQIMVNSKKVYKEKSFSLLDENKQIIHGIFDVVCLNENEVTIIDYKTDSLTKDSSDEVLKLLHQPQMEYYKMILSKFFNNHKIIAIVYYLSIDRHIII